MNARFAAHPFRRLLSTVASLFLFSAIHCPAAQAVSTCVSTASELQVALQVGQFQSGSYAIKIVKGTYLLNAAQSVQLSAPTSILGGYSANCASRSVDAANTVIDFGGAAAYYYQPAGGPAARISIDGVTMQHGSSIYLAAGQYHPIAANDTGELHLSRTRITNFNVASGEAVTLYATSGEVTLENVLLDHLSSAQGQCLVSINLDSDGTGTLNCVTANLAGNRDLCLSGDNFHGGTYSYTVGNSVIWATDGSNAALRGVTPGNVGLVNVLSHGFFGNGNLSQQGAINADPKWVNPAASDFRLQANSPAVNSGTNQTVLGVPEDDIEGNPRTVGSAPDRGAYESPYSDFSVFTVSSTADSGPNTLRQAILDANSVPNPGTIRFDFAAGGFPFCPATIKLASALPDITSPILIDGYSQPLSAKNSDPDSFNGTICVLIKPASGTLPAAIRVPSAASGAALTLRGIGFGGFSQPLLILGGSNHVIAGNQFGGSVGGVALPGATLNNISIGVNASGSLIVGGQSLADRNVIGGAAANGLGNGINVQAGVLSSPAKCQIVNNLIGLGPDAATPLPNEYGINLAGSGCSVQRNRIAGNNKHAIWINGGGSNVIQRNIIGVNVNGFATLNNGAGIFLSSGLSNVIGTTATSDISGSSLGNTIRYMTQGGVLIGSNASIANSVRGNTIYDNGIGNNGMDIDLGTAGPTSNDFGDPDSGPNGGQNFPLVTALSFAGTPAPGAVDVPATVSATLNSKADTLYRIDAYFANGCPSTGRGHAAAYLGSHAITLAAGVNDISFSMGVTIPNTNSDGQIALTATDEFGSTSELGPCYSILSASVVDPLFKDGFE